MGLQSNVNSELLTAKLTWVLISSTQLERKYESFNQIGKWVFFTFMEPVGGFKDLFIGEAFPSRFLTLLCNWKNVQGLDVFMQ